MDMLIEQSQRSRRAGDTELSRLPSTAHRRNRRADLSGDVRQWVDPCSLALLVSDEAELESMGFAGEGRSRTAMLRMLAFAYAANVLASEDISTAGHTDAALRWLGGGETPFANEVSGFRLRHRLELESLLTRVLARVFDTWEVSYPDLLREAKDRLDIARHLDDTAD